MGTRGSFGFRHNEQDVLAYNHFDSYPDGLGLDVLAFAVKYANQLPKLRELVVALQVVSLDMTPTPEQIVKCAPYTNLGVSRQSTDDWYCLLRECQGDLDKTLESGFVLECLDRGEYSYILNLDDATFEAYDGDEKRGSWPLTALPDGKEFMAAFSSEDDE